MGIVAVELKIMPSSPEVDLEKIKSEISSMMKLQDSKIEPLAFGLNQLKILVVVPDSEMGDIEGKIKEIEGVSEVESGSVTIL
ncbi:MAG: elongation factor 1-beta [Candidatus Aenigmarchaeota archaeon]|nr:elongation factor 1-beta [Candidatus Aenigmarchaeota archaeon]